MVYVEYILFQIIKKNIFILFCGKKELCANIMNKREKKWMLGEKREEDIKKNI